MALCEMCGKEERLVQSEIEGVELNVCNVCSKYGEIKKKSFSGTKRSFQPIVKRSGPELKIVGNYAELIRGAREKRELKQEDFAKFLNEKESVVAKWESGTLKPKINSAKYLERKLGLNLIEKDEKKSVDFSQKKRDDTLTLGDFVKVRKRK